jgi:general secretion pathway protein K
MTMRILRMREPGGRDSGARAGFVLPTVLALLLVLSALAAAVTLRTRTAIALAAASRDRLTLDAEADGIVRLIGLWLALEARGRASPSGLPLNGEPVRCRLGPERSATIVLQDQGGLLDLNAAPRPLLEEVLRRLGIAPGEALAVAAQIVDFRDPDDVPEPNGGAESRRYQEAGLAYGPRNAPFASPDEIDQLPAVTPEIYAALRPALTVQNGRGVLDPARMERRLAARLPPAALSGPGLGAAAMPSDGVRFEVSAMVESGRGARAIRSGLVGLDDPGQGTGAILSWRRPSAWEWGPARPGHPACGAVTALFGAP